MTPRIIAEVGCNHKGDMEIAKEFIRMAAVFCNVDVVKFQKRNPKESLTEEQYNSPHPNPYNSYGETYGDHREFLEFDLDQHKELKAYCDEFNIKYSSSVWDLTSAKGIASLEPELIKIGSASNLHFEMLGWLCDHYGGEIHLSLGMTTKKEEEQIIKFFEDHKREKDLVIYHCTSGYPIDFEDAYLLEITRLKEWYGHIVKEIGFSGHHNGIAIDAAAYTLGATTIERHFTLNRTWKGTDHAASLEPDGLRRLARNVRSVEKTLAVKEKDILDIEIPQRQKLKYGG